MTFVLLRIRTKSNKRRRLDADDVADLQSSVGDDVSTIFAIRLQLESFNDERNFLIWFVAQLEVVENAASILLRDCSVLTFSRLDIHSREPIGCCSSIADKA